MAKIETPCKLICIIHPKAQLCTGCGRTGREIVRWIQFTPEERRAVMDTLPARMAAMEAADKP